MSVYGIILALGPDRHDKPRGPNRALEQRIAGIRFGSERQSGQRWKRLRAGSLHDLGTIIFDRALTDTEIHSDILAGVTRNAG